MEIRYNTKKTEKQFSSKYKKNWTYPAQVSKKLVAIETFIKAATSLEDIKNYPSYRFHKLVGDRKGEWSISVGNTGYRVTVIPCGDDDKPIIKGDVIAQCKFIKIVLVTEVSNHYE